MSNNPIIPLPTDTVFSELGEEFDFKWYSSSSLSAMGAYVLDIGGWTDGNQSTCVYLNVKSCLLKVVSFMLTVHI